MLYWYGNVLPLTKNGMLLQKMNIRDYATVGPRHILHKLLGTQNYKFY